MKVRLTMAICFMLVLLVSLGAIASLASEPPSLDTPGESTLSESDAGRVVDLQPTDLLVLRLEGNPSTGYGWRVQEMDRGVLRPMPGEEFEPQSDLPGAPGIQTLRFAGVTRGQTDLRLVYQRPWERDAAPAKTFSVQVRSQGRFKGAYTPVPSPANAATSLGAPSATQERPFDPYIEDGKVYGRGTCDAKGQLVTLWLVMQAIRDLDLDLILGNHGLNSRIRASKEKPLTMYVNDFDLNGSVEHIICAFNGDTAFPLAMKDDLVRQIPTL